jgi:hypothetical protein
MLISATVTHPNWNRLVISLYNSSICNSHGSYRPRGLCRVTAQF